MSKRRMEVKVLTKLSELWDTQRFFFISRNKVDWYLCLCVGTRCLLEIDKRPSALDLGSHEDKESVSKEEKQKKNMDKINHHLPVIYHH